MPRPTQENDITSSLNDLEIVLSGNNNDKNSCFIFVFVFFC